MNTGKGANTIISMLHHFLSNFSLGEVNLHLHADNCSGQNKNRYMMQYLAWRVLVGLNKSITLSFLIVGHTKFSPDWCFGLLKREFRRTKVGCLDDIARVVEKSAKVNHVQLVGTQDGQVLVPTYDWSEFFSSHFRQTALKGIKSLHHLRFSHTHPGSVYVKESVSSPERAIKMVQSDSWSPSKDTLPPVIPPQSLSQERKQYLFEKIRDFCPEGCKDLVCPDPAQESVTPPAPKRQRQH